MPPRLPGKYGDNESFTNYGCGVEEEKEVEESEFCVFVSWWEVLRRALSVDKSLILVVRGNWNEDSK